MEFWKEEPVWTPPIPDHEAEIARIRAEFEEKLEAADALARITRANERLKCAAIVADMYGFAGVNEILEKILRGNE